MTTSAARRLWWTIETLHDLVYFAPAVRQTGLALGLRGYWMTYFAFRAAPLGAVGSAPVVAIFGGFAPDMVAKALPDAWSRVSPAGCLETRAAVAADALVEVGVDPDACVVAGRLLTPAVAGADPTGRPLFAANASVDMPTDPVAALWQLSASLREHRGDGHIAALVAAGISGLEAHLLQVAAGRYPGDVVRAARGWSEQDWAAAATRLIDRGLLSNDESPALSTAGGDLLDDIENRTDEASWTGCLAVLGEPVVEQVIATLQPSVDAVRSSGVIPDFNPTGLPVDG